MSPVPMFVCDVPCCIAAEVPLLTSNHTSVHFYVFFAPFPRGMTPDIVRVIGSTGTQARCFVRHDSHTVLWEWKLVLLSRGQFNCCSHPMSMLRLLGMEANPLQTNGLRIAFNSPWWRVSWPRCFCRICGPVMFVNVLGRDLMSPTKTDGSSPRTIR